jgi:hypothetical protein
MQKKLIGSLLAMSCLMLSSLTFAAGPVQLSAAEMDNVSAGTGIFVQAAHLISDITTLPRNIAHINAEALCLSREVAHVLGIPQLVLH